jgi:hypothetical protein
MERKFLYRGYNSYWTLTSALSIYSSLSHRIHLSKNYFNIILESYETPLSMLLNYNCAFISHSPHSIYIPHIYKISNAKFEIHLR